MKSAMDTVIGFHERHEQLARLRELDREAMTRWSDAALAAWQTEWPTDSPQWRVGEHEWQRRLLARELHGLRGIAVLGAVLAGVFGLAGVWLGAFLNARGFF